MRKKILALTLVTTLFFVACNNSEKPATETPAPEATTEEVTEDVAEYDPKRGEGEYDESNLQLAGLDAAMATKGKAISETKCMSCHKATDEKLVGPGWKGVTQRNTAHWIMNFITNPDAMLDKDPELQKQIEICLVRMPDQNLSGEEAREILEFMRQNDGVK